ncbi:hypothetical protein ANCCEY_13776, partial [Ancylostoma ceylanicum]
MPHSRSTERPSLNAPGRQVNMMNDLAPELGRRNRLEGSAASWGAYESIEYVVKKTKNTRFRAHLFNTTVLP